ncbi:MAG: M20/M25/M40 family metallo-hydrolase, partial [Pontiella sp.]|nr:M20/M25/M40 family metallo-hydrolase [Pontiella sp.]
PGTVKAPRIMFSAHMDTVPLCKGAVPFVKGNRIVAKGKTGLGGDDRSGCAANVTLAETILKSKIPHPPITLLFPIAEENGLHGSRMVRFKDLGNPAMGFNLDGQFPNELVIGAMSAVRWQAEISGISTHAGLEPHKGISAGLIGAQAMATISDKGYFGRIVKGNRTGTSNLGSVNGGEASNQVMDQCIMSGECRSHSPAFLKQIVKVYKTSFEQAAQSATNDKGRSGKVKFTTISDYNAFRLKKSEPCVKIASQAVETAGKKPNPLVMDAGLDANNFNEKGLPTVTLGTGSHKFHQVEEYVDIREYLFACKVLLNIVHLTIQ